MTYHAGQSYRDGAVSIGPPNVEQIRRAPIAPDVANSMDYWLSAAKDCTDIHYFCIYLDETPVGQILLHDINTETGEALIGYHILDPQLRGRGIGTIALTLLGAYVIAETNLKKLVIITGRDNAASKAIAQKCGFEFAGGAWEDPENLVVFKWKAVRS